MAARVRLLSVLLLVAFVATSCARTGLWVLPDDRDERTNTSGGTGSGAGGSSSGSVSVGGSFGGTIAGGTTGQGGTPGIGSGGTSGMAGRPSHEICPSLAVDDPGKTVLSYVSGGELWMARADGTRARVNAVAEGDVTLVKKGDFLFVVRRRDGQTSFSLVDRNGNVLWSLSEVVTAFDLMVNERGDAAIALEGAASRGLAILSNGREYSLTYPPLGPPRADGWVPLGYGALDVWGFVHLESGQLWGVPVPPASRDVAPFVQRGRIVYLGKELGSTELVVTEPELTVRHPTLPLDVAATTLVPTDAGVMVLEHGVPRLVLDGESLAAYAVPPLERDPAFEPKVFTHGTWALLVEGQTPTHRIDLRDGTATRLVAPPLPPRQGVLDVRMTGRFGMVAVAGTPTLRVNLETAVVEPIDMNALAPLRTFGGNCVVPTTGPALMEGGIIAAGLRHDLAASLYLLYPDGTTPLRISAPVAGVQRLGVIARPWTWALYAEALEQTTCDDGSWPLGFEPGAIVGDSVQVVTHLGQIIPFEGYRGSEFLFDDTGVCAIARNFAYDFVAWTYAGLPPDATQITFW